MELLCEKPRKRFGIPLGNEFSIWDLDRQYVINPEEFLSLGRATPFAGHTVWGRCLLTVCHGKAVYCEENEYGKENGY